MRGLRAAAEFACTAHGRRMGAIVKARIMETYLHLPI
jgi:hypothetical protein